MPAVLYAYYSESSVPTGGSSYWTLCTGGRVRATHVYASKNMESRLEPHIDEYGRLVPAPPLPEDLVYQGEVYSDSFRFDPDHMDPHLSYGPEFLAALKASSDP